MQCEGQRGNQAGYTITWCHNRAVLLVAKRSLDREFNPPRPLSLVFWTCLECYESWRRKSYQVMAIMEEDDVLWNPGDDSDWDPGSLTSLGLVL